MYGELTVTPRFTQAILQTADRLGLALPADLVAAVQAEPRVPLSLQDRLWQAFCESADDPLIGLRLGLAIQVGHLDTAGLLLMTCESLEQALDSLLEYHPIVGEGGDFSLQQESCNCRLVYAPHYEVYREQRVEAVFACLLTMCRWATGEGFQPESISFEHAALDAALRYSQLLDVEVHFEQPHNALRFSAEALALPLIQANPQLCAQLRELADRSLAGLDSHSLSGQVRQLLQAHPRWGKERIAEDMHMSGRHLVRRLADDGASFKLLRASVLQGMAERHLRANANTADVAEKLGFSDESAFTKAFKRWAGVTPAQFREQQM